MNLNYQALLISLLTLAACSGGDSGPATGNSDTVSENAIASETIQPQVVEFFEVGREVYVRSLNIEEQTNLLWVGTSAGVLAIDLDTRESVHTFIRDDGLANEYVFAIGIDDRGNKWFGTNAGGVSRYRDGEWDIFFPMHGLADYWIYAFAQQQNGDYWIGTWAGANKLDLDTMEFTTYIDELINEWVYGIDVDSRDRVWFGTEGGISMFDGSSWREWNHDNDGVGARNEKALPNSKNTGLGTRTRHDLNILVDGSESYNPNYVFSLLVTPDDSVWVGTWGGGVSRFDGESWHNLTEDDGLAGNIVYSIAREHGNNTLWFGTNHGLSRYDGTTWQNYGVDDGLLDNHVYTIVTGKDGDIWAGTKHGVVLLSYESN